MEKLNEEGLVCAIGVSNFYPDRLVDLIEHNEITPLMNQIETHPFFQRADYQELLRERGVQIESWGPFAEGRNNLFTNPTLTKSARHTEVDRSGRAPLAHPARRDRHPEVGSARANARETSRCSTSN